MTDPIKARIQELVPNSEHYCCRYQTTKRDDWCDHCETTLPTLTLAVVLRAILKTNPANRTRVIVESSGQFRTWTPDEGNLLGVYWNLEEDEWESQSAETQAFIGRLLGL